MIPLYLSTGCYNKKEKTIEDMILRAASASHDIAGVELSFLSPYELESFNCSKKIDNALKDMKCTLHMPTKGIIYEKSELCDRLINKALRIYEHYSCEHAVFHYQNIKDFDYLINNFSAKILIENKDKISAKDCINEMKIIFDFYPEIGMVIDLEHAKAGACEIISEFKNKICEVHWSSPKININHNSYYSVLKNFESNILCLKNIGKPVVIEVELKNEEELKKEYIDINHFVIRQEIALLNHRLNE